MRLTLKAYDVNVRVEVNKSVKRRSHFVSGPDISSRLRVGLHVGNTRNVRFFASVESKSERSLALVERLGLQKSERPPKTISTIDTAGESAPSRAEYVPSVARKYREDRQ